MNCIFIIGFMASGKSTIGKLLSEKLSCSFMDTDTEIEQQEDMNIEEIFAKRGERHFRNLESALLRGLGARCNRERMVISTGGGMPCSRANLRFMKKYGVLVYLKSEVDEIISRIENSALRPVFHDISKGIDVKEGVYSLLKRREKFYNQADITIVNRSIVPPEKIAERIACIVRKEDGQVDHGKGKG